MSTYYADDGRSMGAPASGRPTCDVGSDSLATVLMVRSDASFVIDSLKLRIRRITWLDDFGSDQAHELCRCSRMLYELSSDGDTLSLSGLSKEDVSILLEFPEHWSFDGLRSVLEDAAPGVRESGPVGPVEADRMAKELVDMMSC